MTKSVVGVAAIVGYNRCHTPRHRIKEDLDVSLGYSSLHSASTYFQRFVLKIPRVKRQNHSAQMNSKRWCSDFVNTCVIEENILDPNIRIKQLLNTEKTGHSEVGNFIIVNFEQISKMFMKLKCPDCDKEILKLALGNKVGFSYVLNLTCSSCAEKVCAVETSNESQGNTVPDINLRITQAFSNIGKGYSAIEKFCMAVNVSPFSSRTYSKCTKLLHTAYGIAAETLQSEIHSEVRKAYEAPTDVPVVDISDSFLMVAG
ncbi:uncharacterized protein TNCV_4019871 [Trichonephila clavipes]|nr:uncharacterized protein TNCV_4019871 [Trichonephila clavipes]